MDRLCHILPAFRHFPVGIVDKQGPLHSDFDSDHNTDRDKEKGPDGVRSKSRLAKDERGADMFALALAFVAVAPEL